ncbi:hypothetical protein [Crossiella cryophila]|uniref:Uncharacterized protein n=1 Tax=Crossiella cryophila TaxID=43355 RepID=A0A7W7CF55_9PSEU|nr:hypothetical protein [Crossiella cryophila]MBB4679847.1 hypothetical protein [Crossiella cryophila]
MTVTDEPAQRDRRFDQTRLLESLHWPMRTNPDTGERELLIGEEIGAIAMRAGLGAETNSMLALHMLTVPVLGCSGRPEEWIFLTGPAGASLRLTTLADLSRIAVCLIPRQTWLPLPSAEAPGRVRWVVPPLRGQTLAPWQSVISAVRSTSSVSSQRG